MWLRILGGLALLALGGVWIAQGSGALHGSVMTGHQIWSFLGAAIGLVGLGLLVGTARGRGKPARHAD